MDILQLRYFVEIAQIQNLTRTADKLHVAQPALSQTISKLEKELDVPLFDRIGKSIRLNKNGECLLRRASEALLILDNVKRELGDLNEAERGTVRLQILVGSSLLPALLMAFKERYPEIRFQLVQLESDTEYDLCITTAINGVVPENSRLLLDEEILLAVPCSHPLADHKAILLSEVQADSFLSLDANKPLRQATDIFCRAAGFEPNIVFESDNPSTLRDLIAAGLGIAFIPSVTWSSVDSPSVRLLHIAKPVCQRRLFITWHKERYLSRAGHLFLDFASQYFSSIVKQ